MSFFTEIGKNKAKQKMSKGNNKSSEFNIIWKHKRPWIDKAILSRENNAVDIIPNFS